MFLKYNWTNIIGNEKLDSKTKGHIKLIFLFQPNLAFSVCIKFIEAAMGDGYALCTSRIINHFYLLEKKEEYR